MKKRPRSLYTPAEVKEVRLALLKQQKGLDALTGLPLSTNKAVTDHDHSNQLVRGVIDRNVNVALGKVENMFNRHLRWCYSGSLSDFLKGVIQYLDRKQPQEYWHPNWIKRVSIDFKKLPVAQQTLLLKQFGSKTGSNATERLKLFKAITLDRTLGYDIIASAITNIKDSN